MATDLGDAIRAVPGRVCAPRTHPRQAGSAEKSRAKASEDLKIQGEIDPLVLQVGMWIGHLAHLHFYVLMIDSVFCEEEAGHLHFQETRLTPEKMAHLQRTIRQRIVRLFVRRGLLDKAEGQSLWDEVFPLICPKCGGTMKIIAFIDDGRR